MREKLENDAPLEKGSGGLSHHFSHFLLNSRLGGVYVEDQKEHSLACAEKIKILTQNEEIILKADKFIAALNEFEGDREVNQEKLDKFQAIGEELMSLCRNSHIEI